MELSAKYFTAENLFKNILAKSSILVIWLDFEYTSATLYSTSTLQALGL